MGLEEEISVVDSEIRELSLKLKNLKSKQQYLKKELETHMVKGLILFFYFFYFFYFIFFTFFFYFCIIFFKPFFYIFFFFT